MSDIMNLINKISYPLVLFGAINWGFIGLFNTDLITLYLTGTIVTIIQVLIGVAAIGVALGLLGKK